MNISFKKWFDKLTEAAGPQTSYIYAKSIGSIGKVRPGTELAIRKNAKGEWEYITLDHKKAEGTIPGGAITNLVQSIKLDNNFVWANTVPALIKKVEELDKPQSPYYYAKSKSHIEGLTPGEDMAVYKNKLGDWKFITLDERKLTGTIPANVVGSAIESIKIKNEAVKSDSVENLHKLVEDLNRKANDYQDAVANAFKDTDKNIVINALAGTGKTTTLKRLAKEFKKPGERWLYLVFNKKNQREANKTDPKTGKKIFPIGVDVATSHSFLGQILKDNAELGRIRYTDLPQKDIRTGKPKQKIKEMLQSNWFKNIIDSLNIPYDNKYAFKTAVDKLAGLAKNYSLPAEVNPEDLKDLIARYEINVYLISRRILDQMTEPPTNYTNQIIEATKELLKASMPGKSPESGLNNIRDHDDTLWFAARHADELVWPKKYSVILADEVQDFNKNQQIVLKKLHDQGARIVAVGDPNQSIYKFRGADSQSFSNIESVLQNTDNGATTLNLPVNYRSGKNIIDFVNQNTHVKDLQAGKEHEGLVTADKTYDDAMEKISEEWDKYGKLRHQTSFISRTNAPLLQTALQLLKNNISFEIIGKDLSREVINFINNITKGSNMNIKIFRDEMNNYADELNNKWKHDVRYAEELKEINEMTQALDSVLEYLSAEDWKDPKTNIEVNDVYSFTKLLRKLFGGIDEENSYEMDKLEKNPKGHVILTTAHRSKGLEFERVYILENDKFANPKKALEEDLQQEKNAQYVAYTRATHQLHLLNNS